MGDKISNGGSISLGSSNVFIGDGGAKIFINDGVNVSFGDGCMVYLGCDPPNDPSKSTRNNTLSNISSNAQAAMAALNAHERVRVMPGNPMSSNPAQQNPYVVYQLNGKAFDINGNLLEPDEPAVHISYDDFDFSSYK